MIQWPRIHRKGIGNSGLSTATQSTRTVRRRDSKATCVCNGYAMGGQHTVGKGRRGSAASRQGARGTDLYRITSAIKWRNRIVVGILGCNLKIEGNRCCLRSDGSAACGLNHKMVQSPRIHREGIGNSGLRATTQSTGAVRRRNRKATRIADGHAVGGQHTVGKGCRGSAASRQGARGTDLYRITRTVK